MAVARETRSVEEVIGDGGQDGEQRGDLRCAGTATCLHRCLHRGLRVFPCHTGATVIGEFEAVTGCVHVVDYGLHAIWARLAVRWSEAAEGDRNTASQACDAVFVRRGNVANLSRDGAGCECGQARVSQVGSDACWHGQLSLSARVVSRRTDGGERKGLGDGVHREVVLRSKSQMRGE
eukprot:COSAG02_NODE_12768_length_1497_cov_3.045064_1_plen_178_part_00